MRLVVDANVLFAALIAKSKTLDLMFSDRLKLYSPEVLFIELEKNKDEILSKSGFDEDSLYAFLQLLKPELHIDFISDFRDWLDKALEVTPHAKDASYFSLALKYSCAIWSNEPRLKKQSKVKVYSTSELMEEVGTEK